MICSVDRPFREYFFLGAEEAEASAPFLGAGGFGGSLCIAEAEAEAEHCTGDAGAYACACMSASVLCELDHRALAAMRFDSAYFFAESF
jgi:hypothetical protein